MGLVSDRGRICCPTARHISLHLFDNLFIGFRRLCEFPLNEGFLFERRGAERASDLDSCTGNSWNCTLNAEPRAQLPAALGIGWRRFYRAELEVQSLSRKTGGSDSTPFDREIKHRTLQGQAIF